MHLRLVLLVCIVLAVGQWVYSDEGRVKRFPVRTPATLGLRALQNLLVGAIKLKSDPPRVIQYVKPGGFTAAEDEVGALEKLTKGSFRPGSVKGWKTLETDQGTRYGKVVGDRFIELFRRTKVHPPMVRVSKMKVLKTKNLAILKDPVEIKYLTNQGRVHDVNDKSWL